MTKSEVKDLLVRIKVFFPRFEAVEKTEGGFRVPAPVIDNWHRIIGFLEFEDAEKILERHISSEAGGKVPGISQFLAGGGGNKSNVWSSAIFDRMSSSILWTPEKGEETQKLHVVWNEKRGVYEDTQYGYSWAFPGE